ncbi:MAG: ANTAR domain-containing protein [Clostridia bacterium]|nr:ANTAR domain-containing protein [Clostridia bacterium]
MIFESRSYRVLLVSSSEKFNGAILPLLDAGRYDPPVQVSSIAAAKRAALESSYDFIIINAPLPDDLGVKFATDMCAGKSTVCLLLVKAELFDETRSKVEEYGVFTLSKPTSASMMEQSLLWMAAVRERLRRMEKKTVSIEDKMEEIRLVNRAKWLLIEHVKMTEPDAHRYIEKQAMDLCVSKREVANDIIHTYQHHI